ncbi:hypothetical protein ASPFODRAFT_56066 [Aspergillus luchuensis CBS 106.47]|uniref:Uncharacterized protein n=1 Tax=Aspergillus luchuensis (strain CBS 106.47) TaxID=1137211 RepID=A0A1M3U0D9_ASPLC|nr:hypothetical protein ASPFODRAFT_56066 [Aspergillus luchuensis CBS 106.47]
MPTQKCSKRRHTEDDSSHCSLETSVLGYKTTIWRTGLPAYVVCSCGGELWGREDVPELNQAAVWGHTLLHHGTECGCAACIKTGVIFMFRAWLLSSSEDRELIALSLVAACGCVSRQYLLSTRPRHGMPGPCRQRTLKWCHGVMPNKAFDMLAGVEGDLNSSFRKDLRSYVKGIAIFLCLLNRPVRQTKLPSFEAYLRERLADGFWYAMKAAVSSPDADRLYLTRYSTGIHEYAIDSACAFDTLGHARALQEDALYGACTLASYVWGANAHLDLLRGQVNQTSATPLPEHWYARVWHDALFGQSTPGELYKWTARTKDHGSFTGDREFTECQSDCSCPERYHKYGLGATLFWARETWCGVSCNETRLQPCPCGKHALAGLHR